MSDREHRVGSIENDRDALGNLTGKLTIRCACGWRVRWSPFRQVAQSPSGLAIGHQLGRIETKAVMGFSPVVDL